MRFDVLNRSPGADFQPMSEPPPAKHASRPAQASAAERRLEFLARASAELASSLDYEATLATVARLAVPEMADWCAVDLLDEDGGIRRLAVAHQDPARVERVRHLQERYPPDPDAPRGVPHVLRTGVVDYMAKIPAELLEQSAVDGEHLRLLRELELRSYIAAPLAGREAILGAITFVHAESGRHYAEADVVLLEDLARRAAVAMENARALRALQAAKARLEEQALQLEDQAAELELQAAELELQNEELQQQADELEQYAAGLDLAYREKAALLESTGEGVYGVDREGRCSFINAAGARLLGLDAHETLGREMHGLIHHSHPDGSPYAPADCPIVRAYRQGVATRGEDERFWRGDGSSFPVEFSAHPVLSDGAHQGAVVVFQDISARRRAAARERLLGTVLEESLNEIYLFDPDTLRFIQVNRGARENLGYSMDELRDLTPVDIKPEFSAQQFAELVAPLRSGIGKALRFETVHQRGDGTHYPVEVNLQLSPAGDGAVFAAIIQDITDRRRAERERERLIRDLEQANRVKADFMATMSHELRTPMNAIIGYADLLEAGVPEPIGEAALGQVRRIRLSARHLLQIIDEILTFSSIEAGRSPVQLESLVLGELLEEVAAIIEPLSTERGLRFHADLDGVPEVVHTDPRKLRQILLNLLGNAVKFTDDGAVVLRARDGGGRLVLEVHDTGIGMAESDLSSAFEPFWQADQSATRSSGGTGLGLAITRRLVELLGGEIRVESEVGRGTTFTVSLPI
jgi:PAS domain S-box-containing protein